VSQIFETESMNFYKEAAIKKQPRRCGLSRTRSAHWFPSDSYSENCDRLHTLAGYQPLHGGNHGIRLLDSVSSQRLTNPLYCYLAPPSSSFGLLNRLPPYHKTQTRDAEILYRVEPLLCDDREMPFLGNG
jgi:hypothetical protein